MFYMRALKSNELHIQLFHPISYECNLSFSFSISFYLYPLLSFSFFSTLISFVLKCLFRTFCFFIRHVVFGILFYCVSFLLNYILFQFCSFITFIQFNSICLIFDSSLIYFISGYFNAI